jgi:ADP-ribosylglycohydrolase
MSQQAPFPRRDALSFEELRDRIHASIAMAVIGDALGAPTEQRSIREIRALFGGRVDTFFEPPADSPYSKGRSRAQITDDSSQMMMLCEILIRDGGKVTARSVADMIIEWSGDARYFPHFAGPSTRAAIERLKAGADPEKTGSMGRETTQGTSDGGAMRVAPVGMVHPGDPEAAVRAAAQTCMPSHFTSVGLAGAAAVAGAVAVALQKGATVLDVVRGAIWAAELGERIGGEEGREVAGPSVARRIELAVELAATSPDLDTAISRIAGVVGTGLSAAEAVPAAIGFVVAGGGDPWQTVVAAANAGDDTDTVACMAGAIAGALAGFSAVPRDRYREVLEANDVDLESLADRLAEVAVRVEF